MTKKDPFAVSNRISWREIEPDGDEYWRHGVIWSPAPPVTGMATWWVLPECDPTPVRVARSSRRHHCGRARAGRSVSGLPAAGSVWLPAGGRIVDIGELFRESDSRSRFAGSVRPPTHAVVQRMGAVAEVAMRQFESLCAAAASDIDMSVSARDVADEAERIRHEE